MITDTYNNSTTLIHPSHIVKKNPNIPKVCISSFSENFTKAVTDAFKAEEIGKIYISGKIPIYIINYGEKKIGYFQSPVGAPAAVIAEELVFETGAEKILYFGLCGYLDSKIKSSELFIPEKAYRDEGTSYHYLPASDFIDIDTADELKSIFDKCELNYTSGYTWTTDAYFRETKATIEKRKEEGCLAVEMECAALMAAAELRNRKAYEFFITADRLANEYRMGPLKREFSQNARDGIIDIALQAASHL